MDTGDESSSSPALAATRSYPRLTLGAMSLLLLLCLIWGGNLASIKIVDRGFEPIFAAAVRSLGSSFLLLCFALVTRQKLRVQRTALFYGFIVSLFFALEFFFLFWGTKYTYASRGTVFLYTSPFWVALGAHYLLRERLTALRLGGLALAFGGVAAVFAAGIGLAKGHILGDIMELLAAVFWAANTLYSKRSMNRLNMTPLQMLFYQLLFSAPLLLVGSLIVEGSPKVTWRLDATLALAHQTIIVAAATYLAWFWILARHQAGQVTAFSFFTPLFGVVIAGALLGEPLPWLLWVGVATVAAGIYLVNRD
jgi:drug/metabolite transporter (DMT)-like permease